MITSDISEGNSREVPRSRSSDGVVATKSLRAPAFIRRDELRPNFGEPEALAPERALAAGVLRQATADLRRFRHTKDRVGHEMYSDAWSWFTSQNTEWPYSFLNVCHVLELAPDTVLDEVFGDAELSWYSHSRRVARRVATSLKGSLSALLVPRGDETFASAKS